MTILALALVLLAIIFAVLGIIQEALKLIGISVICMAIALALNTYPLLGK